MIKLRISLDDSWVELCRTGNWNVLRENWVAFCRENDLDRLLDIAVFETESVSIDTLYKPLRTLADYLLVNADRSVAHIGTILPLVTQNIHHDLIVKLLPFGRYNFGPKDGLQIFSLYPDADPEEAYLFLIHVYYHEITPLSYTEQCKRCSSNQRNINDLKNWVKLLIRNEGIANYAILENLLRFRDKNIGYSFKYFTYANKIGDAEYLERSFNLIMKVFEYIDSDNFNILGLEAVNLMKSKFMPAINLIGIHMAKTITDHFGVGTLKDVYKKDADQFFKQYAETVSRPFNL